jgi:hypothetical protein
MRAGAYASKGTGECSEKGTFLRQVEELAFKRLLSFNERLTKA